MSKSRNKAVFFALKAEIHTNMYGVVQRLRKIARESIQEAITERNAIASGKLLNSIRSEIETKTTDYILRVFSTSPHFYFADEGTRPHFPPIKPIAQWIRSKGIRGSFRLSKDIERAAFLIARAISIRGTPAKKFVILGMRKFESRMTKEIKDALAGN